MNADVLTAQVMSREQAERVTEQIAYRIDSITENYEVVMSLMRDALARNAHEALGYASPGAYIAERFGQSLQTLGVALRREFVHELSDAGLSTRAIAPVFDVSHVQISKDLKSGVNQVNTSTTPVEAEGFTVNPGTGEIIDGPTIHAEPIATEHTVTEKIKTTTGLDGKEYKRPEPRPREQAPVLTGQAAEQDNADTACREIGKALLTFDAFDTDAHRARVLTKWWPMGKDNIQPMHAALFTTTNLRRIAAAMVNLADEMEASNA